MSRSITERGWVRRWLSTGSVIALTVGAVYSTGSGPASAAGSGCGATVNPVVCENQQPGTPESVWDINGAGDATIQGFSTDISVNAGSTVNFKIKTDAGAYSIDIYRLGWYQGNGARHIASVTPSAALPQTQPACASDPSTLLVDCGTWAVSASWAVPSTAVSGVYVADLKRTDTGGMSQITFIVRNDASTSDIVYQTSDETWEAYNTYGGSDYYTGTDQLSNSQARAFKISYNRPFATRGDGNGRDFLFSNEYPTIRFLERNGYDVSYIAGMDTDRFGATLLPKHKVFMSVGHDEYWSQQQRTNVEKARDAGVNLMFLSGNEVYWHTRFEPSIDGSGSSYRTLVCYKETWDNAPTDPSGEATATWRDPRFSAKPGGSNPENSLSGTLYMANTVDLPIQVSGAEGKLRLWRSTGLGSVPDSTETTLAPHTIGYESDEDLDNGARPAGLIDLSTTTGAVSQYLQDFGSTVKTGTTTHHVTMYRAASGALVFGAGTIQWAWGLDSDHDGYGADADQNMQQATVNMLADMHAAATTLMPGLTAATASTDTQSPTSTITSPNPGDNLPNGSPVTVTGTATDNGGGQVAGVEVSLDGGTSWHPATGRANWSYTTVLHGTGTITIKSRATDDSGNIESPGAGVVISAACPCSLFGSAAPTAPGTADAGDTAAVELGVKFSSDENGWVTGIRFYKSAANAGTHTGTLWSAAGTQLATGTFTGETASGWQTLQFASPVAITKNTVYVASYFAPQGHYADSEYYFWNANGDATPLHPVEGSPTDPTQVNGVYTSGDRFPNQTFRGSNYYVDVLFGDIDTYPPSLNSTAPAANDGGVPVTVHPAVTFSEPVQQGSLTFTLTDDSHHTVPGAVAYDATSHTATFTPASSLTFGSWYAASVQATDVLGNAMTAPQTWSFMTIRATPTPGVCPCSIWDDTATPGSISDTDSLPIEVGSRFTSDSDGSITGVRYFKGPLNGGVHTVSLWDPSGQLLASATATGETNSGWQSVAFASSVAVTAGMTYTVSYFTSVGHYSTTDGQLAATAVDNFPLHIPQLGGVYRYGGGYPTSSSSDNYWVDPIFTVPAGVVPHVVQSVPSAGATSVPTAASITAGFDSAVRSGTVMVSLTGSDGTTVGGSAALDPTHRVVTFTPSTRLSAGLRYTVTVSGALSLGGTAQAPSTWSFTTNDVTVCPCTAFESDASPGTADVGDGHAISLGMQFSPSADGYITGARFYKSAANTGTHTGNLWSSAGALLATATFTGETASGWQTVTFSHPVIVHAGTTYTVSYFAPSGHFAEDDHFFDAAWSNPPLTAPVGAGTYRYGGDLFPSASFGNANYWVDAVFHAGYPAPSVVAGSPIDGSTSNPVSAPITALFGAPVAPASIAFAVKDAGGNAVSGAVSYNSGSTTATFVPSSALAAGAVYQVAVTATAPDGTAMAAPATWSFTTNGLAACPCTMFASSALPVAADSGDGSPISAGVAFTPTSNGDITGVRFYKSAANTGTHTASLWQGSTRLATATFTSESPTGWQTVTFAQPIGVTAGTTYVVSYFAPNGHYAEDDHFFDTAWVNAPLAAPAGGNGLYTYGADALPTSSFANANYWVDPIFNVGNPPPVVVSTSPTGGSTSVQVSTSVTARLSGSVDPASIAFAVTDSSGTTVPGSVSYDSSSTTASFVPPAPFTAGMTYHATVNASAIDGTPMAAPASWSFTTNGTSACPCTMFASSTAPMSADSRDASATSVGVRFSPSVDGFVTGVRFYKSSANTGVHTGSLWGSDGTRLGTATFGNETATGWQNVTFAQPVPVTAGATYVASYFAPRGHYAEDDRFFDAAWVNAPLSAPGGGNGLYSYGADVLPTSSFANANYWVDPVFSLTQPPAIVPQVSGVSASSTGSTVTVVWSTDEPSSSSVSYGTAPSSLTLSASTAGLTTSHSVVLSGLTQTTTYYYRVTSTDAAGGTTTYPAVGTAPSSYLLPDTTPPVISGAAVVGSGTSATVTWSTDEASTSQVAYGTSSSALTSSASSAGLTTSHTVLLTGLTQGTTYYYRLTSADTAGNAVSLPAAGSGPAVFVMPDTTPPVITAVSGGGSGSTGTITWATNESATSQVAYGTSAASLTLTASFAGLSTAHTVALSGLSQGITYYFRVTSADASGNTNTSPATGSPPATFMVPDTTPPVISAVAATGSGTTATVSWTTNEPATSQVSYGTTTTSLTSSASTPGLSTGHSVVLTALAANTRYYFRVTSADAAANSATSPLPPAVPTTYAPTTTPMVDTTAANFGTGTVSSTYVASNGDGEVVLNPTKGVAEFAGTTLPSTLASTATVTGGKTTVANGVATVSGANVTTVSTTGNGIALETLATLNKNQSIGFITSSNANVKASFSVNASNQLVATVNDGGFNNASGVAASSWVAAPHTFRIEWTSSAMTFYLDNAQVYTHAFTTWFSTNYKLSFADTVTTDANLVIDWVRVTPYATSGTFTSRVFDASATVAWDALSWDSTVPSGTTLTVKVRTGPTATPGTSWTAFTTITSGTSVAKSARYLQYQLSFTTSGSAFTSPAVRSVQAAFHVP